MQPPDRAPKRLLAIAPGESAYSDLLVAAPIAPPSLLARNPDVLASLVVAIGLCLAGLALALPTRLFLFWDGAYIAHALISGHAWDVLWSHYPSRLAVYVLGHLPAELYLGRTGDVDGAVRLVALIHGIVPVLGLLATARLDRSPNACLLQGAAISTTALAFLMFGFPSEIWWAHAAFWPALAAARYAPAGLAGALRTMPFALLLAFTHCAAPVLVVVVAIAALDRVRSLADAAVTLAAFSVVGAIWLAAKIALTPDPAVAAQMGLLADGFFNPRNLINQPIALIVGATLLTFAAWAVLARITPATALPAALIVGLGVLAGYYALLDERVYAIQRYHARTLVVLAAPLLAIACLAGTNGWITRAARHAAARVRPLARVEVPWSRAGLTFAVLALLVHVVESTKFVEVWRSTVADVAAVARGEAAPAASGAHTVFPDTPAAILPDVTLSAPITGGWPMPYLSVLLASDLRPTALVVRREYQYGNGLHCRFARLLADRDSLIPAESRLLVRDYVCAHTPAELRAAAGLPTG